MIALGDDKKFTTAELTAIVRVLVDNQNALLLQLRGHGLTEEEQNLLHAALHDEQHPSD